MRENANPDEGRFSVAERDLVEQTSPWALDNLSKEALQSLTKRLRSARDRARRIGRQHRRDIRGKAHPKGNEPARDSAGTEAKAQALVETLNRVSGASEIESTDSG